MNELYEESPRILQFKQRFFRRCFEDERLRVFGSAVQNFAEGMLNYVSKGVYPIGKNSIKEDRILPQYTENGKGIVGT